MADRTKRHESEGEPRRYLVRATRYGFGVWDTVTNDWWIPRLDMSRRDAGEIVAELEARAARDRAEEAFDSDDPEDSDDRGDTDDGEDSR